MENIKIPMRNNVAFPIGNILLIDKVNKKFSFFDTLLGGICTKAKNMTASAKLFVYNRLGDCISVNRFTSVYSTEVFEHGF